MSQTHSAASASNTATTRSEQRKKEFSKTLVLSMGRNHCHQLGFSNQNAQSIYYPKYLNPTLRMNGLEEGYEKVEHVYCVSNDTRGYSVFLTSSRKHLFVCGSTQNLKKKKKKQQPDELFPETTAPTKLPFVWKDSEDFIDKITLGSEHLFVLTNKGKIYGLGSNKCFELGLPKERMYDQLSRITINNGEVIRKIVCGESCTFFITSANYVFASGLNNYGKLGTYNAKDVITVPLMLPTMNNIEDIYCGSSHTIFKKTDGSLYGCGNNLLGQLGLGSTELHAGPVLIEPFTDQEIVSVKCGENFTMFLNASGEVFVTGYFNFSTTPHLDDSENMTSCRPIKITYFDSKNVLITSIECGSDVAYFTTHNGDVYGAGANSYGALGHIEHSKYADSEDEENWFDRDDESFRVIQRMECFDDFKYLTTQGWKVCSSPFSDSAFFIRIPNVRVENFLKNLMNGSYSDVSFNF
ncbi:predicted protein [Naegleria gruberi]|uniref:Predicted protein n=1 Tax=Naegleria gruberi TaxID=5762 RepID=D2VTC9_NAEGR|nr:uncharacterized protein NAEGRDRAFT_72255 [Naegleria gruberi]EFC39909.1 predicted protein [Naegleria gruberi]|eukprot:XP_002672653.1 predicted protein [Naegleria gruberi strain NEG-M]